MLSLLWDRRKTWLFLYRSICTYPWSGEYIERACWVIWQSLLGHGCTNNIPAKVDSWRKRKYDNYGHLSSLWRKPTRITNPMCRTSQDQSHHHTLSETVRPCPTNISILDQPIMDFFREQRFQSHDQAPYIITSYSWLHFKLCYLYWGDTLTVVICIRYEGHYSLFKIYRFLSFYLWAYIQNWKSERVVSLNIHQYIYLWCYSQ